MKKILILIGFCLLALVPLACTKTYTLGPLTVVPATPTPTSTPTFVSTPGCGYTNVSVPVPITPYMSPTPDLTPVVLSTTPVPLSMPGQNFVIRNLADWEAYYGASPAPAPPVDFSTQMLLVNLQVGSFDTEVVYVTGVCWDSSKITVSCELTLPCPGRGPILYPIVIVTPTPGTGTIPIFPPITTWYYSATAVAVPLSSLPAEWDPTLVSFGPCAWY